MKSTLTVSSYMTCVLLSLIQMAAAQKDNQNSTRSGPLEQSRLLPGRFNDVVEHKIETPSQLCQAPRTSQGLEYLGRGNLTAKQKLAAGSNMCVLQEFVYWNGEKVNSTLPAVNSFNNWLANLIKIGGRVEWQTRVDGSKVYYGISLKGKYYFVQFGDVAFDSALIITSTRYTTK